MNTFRTNSLIALMTLVGLGIFSYLSFMLMNYPLFDFAVNDIDWTREWLYMTIIDYYGAVISLIVIVICSEDNLFYGIMWSLGFCLLGSPICCLYIIYRLIFKTVLLMPNHRGKNADLAEESESDAILSMANRY